MNHYRRWLTASLLVTGLSVSLVAGCSQPEPTADTGATAEAPAATAPSTTAPSTTAPSTIEVFAEDGIAIKGADPVAYFTDAAYVPGDAAYTYEWMGATWQFASAEHRDMFAANPEQYAPRYGGYCAWAVSQGKTAPIDPSAWKIVDGKLYLNYNADIQQKWANDIPGNIAKADQNWPAVLEK